MAKPLRIWIWNSNTIASHVWTDNTNDLGLNKITARLFSSLSGHATSTKMSSKLRANRALARFLLKKFIHEWYIYIHTIGRYWQFREAKPTRKRIIHFLPVPKILARAWFIQPFNEVHAKHSQRGDFHKTRCCQQRCNLFDRWRRDQAQVHPIPPAETPLTNAIPHVCLSLGCTLMYTRNVIKCYYNWTPPLD